MCVRTHFVELYIFLCVRVRANVLCVCTNCWYGRWFCIERFNCKYVLTWLVIVFCLNSKIGEKASRGNSPTLKKGKLWRYVIVYVLKDKNNLLRIHSLFFRCDIFTVIALLYLCAHAFAHKPEIESRLFTKPKIESGPFFQAKNRIRIL